MIAPALEVLLSTGPPTEDLARESWLLEEAATGRALLLLASWRDPVVVLGYGQPATDVDLGWCRDHGIPVLRRITGGTGVVHAGDLSVSLALPRSHSWARGIHELYARFLEPVAAGLADAGARIARAASPGRAGRDRSPICFFDQLAESLVMGGRKCVGCAQSRRKGAVLIHAAVLLGLDPRLYARAFGVAEDRVRRGLAPAAEGADWRRVGRRVGHRLAAALELELVEGEPDPVPPRLLEPYSEERWAPCGALSETGGSAS